MPFRPSILNESCQFKIILFFSQPFVHLIQLHNLSEVKWISLTSFFQPPPPTFKNAGTLIFIYFFINNWNKINLVQSNHLLIPESRILYNYLNVKYDGFWVFPNFSFLFFILSFKFFVFFNLKCQVLKNFKNDNLFIFWYGNKIN